MKNWTYVFVSSKERLTDTGENFLKWTRVFSTRCWVILVAQARRKKREENSVSTFGRFSLWTSFESSPVSVKTHYQAYTVILFYNKGFRFDVYLKHTISWEVIKFCKISRPVNQFSWFENVPSPKNFYVMENGSLKIWLLEGW